MLSDEKILRIVKDNILPQAQRVNLAKLKGDASDRSYFRVMINNGETSLILMHLARAENSSFPLAANVSEEGFSEEKVTISNIPVKELPYINISEYLYKCNVGVPCLFYYDREDGILFLEDLGDMTLAQVLKGSNKDECIRYYQMAIDELLRIQIDGTRRRDDSCIAFARAFDISLLMWEFDHFLEYGIEEYYQIKIKDKERGKIREIFLKISESVSSGESFFTHRDYHSRNLMVQDGRIRVIDFQDALLGPPTYDLASLLRDSYTILDDEIIDELIEYYLRESVKMGGFKSDENRFRRLFDFISIQRNLKAAGRFVYISRVKGNDSYLKYIPNTLGYVKKNLARYNELEELRKLLEKYI
ncbi:MAG: aminoglycoside phosphotransferase family protein [Nitrospirota bacterium]